MIVAGTRLYGKVDQVPGLFHLATEFFHIQFVPIGPTRSYVVLHGTGTRGIRVGLSGKSILFAYLRAILVLAGGAILFTGVIGGLRCLEKNPNQPGDGWIALSLLAVGLVCFVLFFLSYRLSRPSPLRAYHLALTAGLPTDVLAEYYAKRLTPEQLADLARQAGTTDESDSPQQWPQSEPKSL
jgi:hypothetical protein